MLCCLLLISLMTSSHILCLVGTDKLSAARELIEGIFIKIRVAELSQETVPDVVSSPHKMLLRCVGAREVSA